MKKIITSAVLFLLATMSFAQPPKTVNITNGSVLQSADTLAVVALKSVTDFSTFIRPVTTVIVTDTLRGGVFNLYSGSDISDDGMIFTDALNRKFKRQTTGEQIFVRWYGAIPTNQNSIDLYPLIVKANNYVRKHKSEFGTVQLDDCAPNTWYYLATSGMDLSGIKFHGSGGQGRQPTTLFQIAAGVQPFDIRGPYADVKDIAIRHYPSTLLDSSTHTFKIRTVVHFENVNIISNPNGNGYDISGCGPSPTNSPDSIFGNPDHSIFINCQAQFCLNGAELNGCDANAILFQNCNFAQNAKWGVFDNGFLGNTYLTTHWASNSQKNNTGARVNDTTFYPYPDSVYNIVGKYPPDNPSYWYKTNFTGSNEQWISTRKYWGGGALWAANPNSNHAVISCYTEDFQANSIISPRSVWYEGTSGSPVVGGIWEHTFGGTKFFTGAGLQAKVVNTDKLVFPNIVNDVLYETEFTKDPATIGSNQIVIPKESGTMAITRIVESEVAPSVADIPYNTSKVWKNLSTGTVRLYVNNGGSLIVLATYGP